MFDWIDPTKLDKSKFERQKAIVRKFAQQRGVGSFLAATGFGKTFVGMMTLDWLKTKYVGLTTIVVVPSDFLRTQWQLLLDEAKLADRVLVETVQTLRNRGPKQCDFLILDELHTYTSDKFQEIFDLITYKMILGMTATLYDDKERSALIQQKCPIFDEITLKECLDNGWVSDYICYNVPMVLTDEQDNYYKNLSGKFNAAFGFLGFDLDRLYKLLKNRKLAKAYADEMGYELTDVIKNAAVAVRNMKLRKKFLYNLPQMTMYVKQLIDQRCAGRKLITFSQSAAFADEITLMYPGRAVSYHTKIDRFHYDGEVYTGKKALKKIVDLYIDDKFDILSTVKAMDQGTNIESIDTSIVCIGTSSSLQALQRTGRQLRKQQGKRAVEFNLYVPGTQSEKWLRDRQKKHPASAIKFITNMEEIVV